MREVSLSLKYNQAKILTLFGTAEPQICLLIGSSCPEEGASSEEASLVLIFFSGEEHQTDVAGVVEVNILQGKKKVCTLLLGSTG